MSKWITIGWLGVTRSIVVAMLVLTAMPGITAAQVVAGHDLFVSLLPDQAMLKGRDRIRIQNPGNGRIGLFLSPNARIRKFDVGGRPHPYVFQAGRLSFNADRIREQTVIELSMAYTCRFDDPAPRRPLNTDNPGYGVSGTISPRGTFILPGAGWYPRVIGAGENFDLHVSGPADTVAVTSGQMVEIIHEGHRTVTQWRIDNPLEGMSLSAGPYAVEQKTDKGITAATYLFPENRSLAPRYLDLSLTYLGDYSRLFGSYPFDAFAVVENFFPTGYGFPGYTLMGGTVLRLPFIPFTSLPHEIVHNWWGNGVRVDPDSGNWSEGLTTYTADYRLKARQSPEAAMDYRRQTMRNYAALVSQATDFPLSRFQSRTDPVTKVIGYDKSAMVFHMLREKMGDRIFWRALRDLYDQFLFKRASWQDLQKVFEARRGRPLDEFFDQWVYRSGAPRLRLETVSRTGSPKTGYRVTGQLIQEKPLFDVALELAVQTTSGNTIHKTVQSSDRRTSFAIQTSEKPVKLIGDPGYHLFRKLDAEEVPPTINDLKGAKALTVVLANRLGRTGVSIAKRLTRGMGIDAFDMINEDDLQAAEPSAVNLLFIGLPERARIKPWFPPELNLTSDSFSLSGQRFRQPADVLFCVVRHPRHRGKAVGLLHPLSIQAADPVIHKLPHYGRYSFLAFESGQNQIKGTWEPEASPLIVHFENGNTSRGANP